MGHLCAAVPALPRTAFPLCDGRVGGGVLHYERRATLFLDTKLMRLPPNFSRHPKGADFKIYRHKGCTFLILAAQANKNRYSAQ